MVLLSFASDRAPLLGSDRNTPYGSDRGPSNGSDRMLFSRSTDRAHPSWTDRVVMLIRDPDRSTSVWHDAASIRFVGLAQTVRFGGGDSTRGDAPTIP